MVRIGALLGTFAMATAACGDDGDGPATDAAGDGAGDTSTNVDSADVGSGDLGPLASACNDPVVDRALEPCWFTEVGEPRWKVVEPQVFVGPVEAGGSYEPAIAFEESWVVGNHDYDPEQVAKVGASAAPSLILPAEAHAPPYDHEVSAMLRARGVRPTRELAAADLTSPNGVWLVLTLVPAREPAQGSTFDYAQGDLIDESNFPLSVNCDLMAGGSVFDNAFDSELPHYAALSGAGFAAKDGWSHAFVVLAEGASALPANASGAIWLCQLRSQADEEEGWDVMVPFKIAR